MKTNSFQKFIEYRNSVLNEIKNNAAIIYKSDLETLGLIEKLISDTMIFCDPSHKEFIDNIWGFMQWAGSANQDRGKSLTTLIHDLSEFNRNRDEKWFCPRTNGYKKYLTGASNVKI